MRKVFLGAIYYLLVTPVGAVARLARDPLRRRFDRNADSHWDWFADDAGERRYREPG